LFAMCHAASRTMSSELACRCQFTSSELICLELVCLPPLPPCIVTVTMLTYQWRMKSFLCILSPI
jgi:hypothetical protein